MFLKITLGSSLLTWLYKNWDTDHILFVIVYMFSCLFIGNNPLLEATVGAVGVPMGVDYFYNYIIFVPD